MDYYAILELPKTATQDEIKKAYRKLALKTHPDRNNGDDTQFKKVQEAYEVLSDPVKRQDYDNPNPYKNFNQFGFQHNKDVNDIFEQFFGFKKPQQNIFKVQLTISLVDAYNGSSHFIQVNSDQGTKLVKLDIPPGCQNGSSLRYDHVVEGAVIVVQVMVLNDTRFEQRNYDLISKQDISVFNLILGSKFKFTTISGKTIEVKIKPKTQPNTQLRLQGMGMPKGNNSYGDQIILLNATIPDNINTEILEIIAKHVK
jgi:curved DNA-binding protein